MDSHRHNQNILMRLAILIGLLFIFILPVDNNSDINSVEHSPVEVMEMQVQFAAIPITVSSLPDVFTRLIAVSLAGPLYAGIVEFFQIKNYLNKHIVLQRKLSYLAYKPNLLQIQLSSIQCSADAEDIPYISF